MTEKQLISFWNQLLFFFVLHYRRSTKRLPLYARGAVGASVYLLVQTIRLDGKNRISS